jgi:hypothetical protein
MSAAFRNLDVNLDDVGIDNLPDFSLANRIPSITTTSQPLSLLTTEEYVLRVILRLSFAYLFSCLC